MSALLLSLAMGAGALTGFPRAAGGPVTHSAVGAAIEGRPTLLLVAGERVVALRADGGSPRGFPLALGAGEAAAGPPAVADVDRDGSPEIAVATASGRVYLWSGGRPVPGFPVSLGARCRAGPSFADVDGDGRPELVVGDARGRLHAFGRNGREPAGWPISLGAAVTSSASSSRFAGGPSLAVGLADGKVHVLALPGGKERRGFPLSTGYEVTGAPAFADLDEDGEMDLVATSQDFKLYAVSGQGKPLPGFPVAAGYRIYEGAAIGDLDGDGKLDVAFASADGMLHAVSADGKELAGFPVRAGNRIFGGVVLGDLGRDGRLALVAATDDGRVTAVTGEGRAVAGFPTPLQAADVGATPVLYDLASDRSLTAFLGLPSGEVHGLRALKLGSATPAAPWPSPARDAARTGRYGPNPPRFTGLAVSPLLPRAGDRLTASWRWASPDALPGDPEPKPVVEWYRNGAVVPDLQGKKELPRGALAKGELWRFGIVPPGGGPPLRSPEVMVMGTPPSGQAVALDPSPPLLGSPVRAVLTRKATDPDGDPVSYRYEWLLDGAPAGVAEDVFPARLLRRGAVLGVRVYAGDGESESDPVLAEARVVSPPPPGPRVALSSAEARHTDRIAVVPAGPVEAEDGLVLHYRWFVDGAPRNLSLATPFLPAGAVRKHQKVRVEVRAFDGEVEGPPTTLEVQVRNSPPRAPVVEGRPLQPHGGKPIRLVVVEPALDPDGDAVTYRYAWKKNGKPFTPPGDGREVPGSEVRRGDRFEAEVWAFDGEEEGPRARVAAEVLNAPPPAPRIAIEPAHPAGGVPLRAVIVAPSVDPDGDPVTYSYAWSRDGKPLGETQPVLPAERFRKHQRIRVTVVPRDDAEMGLPANAEVEIANAPPGAPAVALEPASPAAGTALRARIVREAPDADGDVIRYRYRWRRDGFPVAVSDGTAASLQEPYWTGAAELPGAEVRKDQRWSVEVEALDGEAHGPPARAEVLSVNSPPPAPRLALVPPAPRRVDGIRLAISQEPDRDGDLVTYRYAWYREGRKLDLPPGQAEIPRDLARKGERWAVEVTAGDGQAEAPPARLEFTIANAPPGPLAVALCDAPVPAGTPLEARVVRPSIDPDGDPVTYRYRWEVGAREQVAKGTARLAAGGKKHDLVRVTVTPFDGTDAGPAAAADCRVANTPPSRPRVALDPPVPTAGSGLRVRLKSPSVDRDGDPVTYRYAWSRNGLAAPAEGAEVPPGVLHHGETWSVTVRPFDGEEEGEGDTATVVVGNTPPPAPQVSVKPPDPVTGDALRCEVTVAGRDADGERVEARLRWLRDGVPLAALDGLASLPEGLVKRGERWRCEAWSSDGTAESARVHAEVAVRNSPPTAPQVVIEPEAPRRSDPLTCRIQAEALDPDGDPVRYAYAWWRDGEPFAVPGGGTRVEARHLKKGQRWRCQVTPADGFAEGAPATAEKVVADSPPGPAVVRVTPASPQPGDVLRCEVAERSRDPDGDAVSYLFGWVRNGQAQSFSAVTDEVPGRLVKAGDRWRCTAIPTDGELSGPLAGAPEITVGGATAGR